MSSDLREFLDGYRGSGSKSKGASFLRIKESGRHKYRLYRWPSSEGPKVMASRWIHFTGEGPPVGCIGEACPVCDVVRKLEAAGDPDSAVRAKDMRKTRDVSFAVVPISNPVEFGILSVSQATAEKILLAVAEVGGYVGAFPRSDGDKAQFQQALEMALPQVCGPHGKDLIVVYDKSAPPQSRYICKVAQVGSPILPQEENDAVPDPAEVRQRIDAARARKAEGA